MNDNATSVSDGDPAPRLVILLNDGIKMSRGKRAAQAVHAALLALGAHPGVPVVVLGATPDEIAECPIQIRDAGWTELAPGTLTAGIREMPGGATPPPQPRPQQGLSHRPDIAHIGDDGWYVGICSCGGYHSRRFGDRVEAFRAACAHAGTKLRADEVSDRG